MICGFSLDSTVPQGAGVRNPHPAGDAASYEEFIMLAGSERSQGLGEGTLVGSFLLVGAGSTQRGENRARHVDDAGRERTTEPPIVDENRGLHHHPK